MNGIRLDDWHAEIIRRVVSQIQAVQAARTVNALLQENDEGNFDETIQVVVPHPNFVQVVHPLPPVVEVEETGSETDSVADTVILIDGEEVEDDEDDLPTSEDDNPLILH